MQHTHEITLWPKIAAYNEVISCGACARQTQRLKYERKSEWRKRVAKFTNKHVPFTIDDRSHEDMVAK